MSDLSVKPETCPRCAGLPELNDTCLREVSEPWSVVIAARLNDIEVNGAGAPPLTSEEARQIAEAIPSLKRQILNATEEYKALWQDRNVRREAATELYDGVNRILKKRAVPAADELLLSVLNRYDAAIAVHTQDPEDFR